MRFCSGIHPLLALAVLAAWPATAAADENKVKANSTTVANVTDTSAKVSAYVELGDGSDPEWWFEYNGSSTPRTATPEGHQGTVSRTLTGLMPETTYTVRVRAKNSNQQANGPVTMFKTATSLAPPAPTPTPAPAPPSGSGHDTPSAARPNGAPVAGALDTTAPEPALGRKVVVDEVSGSIFVRLPGAKSPVALGATAGMPVGSVVDARRGVIELSSVAGGRTQVGRFWGAVFQVRQSRSGGGMTDLVLRGGRPEGCGRRSGAARAAAVTSKRRPRKGLWGKDKGGRFRTHGRNSVATVRGTTWLVEERCEGTLTRVTEGAVVVRDARRKRSVTVRAGGRYLARDRRSVHG
jgi:hypothetical protein